MFSLFMIEQMHWMHCHLQQSKFQISCQACLWMAIHALLWTNPHPPSKHLTCKVNSFMYSICTQFLDCLFAQVSLDFVLLGKFHLENLVICDKLFSYLSRRNLQTQQKDLLKHWSCQTVLSSAQVYGFVFFFVGISPIEALSVILKV